VRLPLKFYARPAAVVARELIGAILSRRFDDGRIVSGRIIETEAYVGPHDLASHSRFGLTDRNAAMFGPAGRAYVFLVYGVHSCLNVVALPGQAVLLRALEPLAGDLLRPRSGQASMRGPGKLCQTLAVDRRFDGEDFRGKRLWIVSGPPLSGRIKVTQRIGVEYAGAWARRKLRFCVAGNPAVSGPKAWR
jgi:DNA-3-methyladenine glycosylase